MLRAMWRPSPKAFRNNNSDTDKNSCDSLPNTMAAFSLCLMNLPDAKLRVLGIILLAEAISRQPNIDSAVWLLVITPTQG